MGALALRFRSLLIGVVCLLLSAGLVFAGGGFSFGAGSGGLDRAADAPGQTVDDGDGDDSEVAPAVHDDGEDADNHGDIVSEAAQMVTPVAAAGAEGFKNHGAFVSCVARKLYLDPEADPTVEIDLAKLTPEDCGQAEAEAEADAEATADDGPGKSAQAKGKGHGNGKGNGRGR